MDLLLPLLLVLLLLGSAPTSIHTLPFIKVVSVDPTFPQIFDTVSVTVQIDRDIININASIDVLVVEFGDGYTGQYSGLNITESTVMVTIGYIYQTPGEYDLRVTVMDALNRTAQDVSTFTVEPRSTVLTFQVNPVDVNSSLGEHFTFEATLKTDQGISLGDRTISFWYSTTMGNQTWYSAAVAKTNPNGQVILSWKPPFDGEYGFRANFDGETLYAPSESTFTVACLVTPEFQVPIMSLLFLICIPILVKIAWQKSLGASSAPLLVRGLTGCRFRRLRRRPCA